MPNLGADSDGDEMPPLVNDDSEDENEVKHKAARTTYVRPTPKTAAGGPPRRTTPASGNGDRGGSVEQQDLGDPLTYLVSLCDGLGAAMVAVSQKTSRLQGFLCEKKDHLRDFTAKKWPQFDSCARIEQVDVEDLAKRIAAVAPDIVLLVAGTPCQPLSGLATDPKGFEDERTAPILHFVRIRDGLNKILADTGVEFKWMLEEVASMSEPHREQLSAVLGCSPVLFHSADFGHIHRPRLYWGLDLEAVIRHRASRPHVDILPAGTVAKGLCVVRWCGGAQPSTWEPHDGYEWRHRGECGTRGMVTPGTGYAPQFPQGRFLSLTTAYNHPADRPPRGREDPHVFQRFLDDERLQPLYTYVKGNMVWKGDVGRALSAEEGEELMGFPAGYTEQLDPPKGTKKEVARRHAIGNSFHVPSIVLMLALLVCPHAPRAAASASAAAAAQWAGNEGMHRVINTTAAPQQPHSTQGTIWDTSWRGGDGDGRTSTSILGDALALFPAEFLGERVETWAKVDRAMAAIKKIDVRPLTAFEAYLRSVGAPSSATGPDIQALWSKSPMHAAAQRQHRPSVAAAAMPSLVEGGNGPEAHLAGACCVEHPFARDPEIELDLAFVIDAYAHRGEQVARIREQRMRLLRRIAAALRELDDYARAQRTLSVPGAPGVAPVMAAFVVELLKWPDKDLPRKLVYGFELSGDIAPAGIYRPIEAKTVGHPVQLQDNETLLGPAADKYVRELETNTAITAKTAIIWELTMQEVAEGLADEPQDKEYFNRKYGVGGWRPQVRHALEQRGRWRPIDDGRRSHSNAMAWVFESLVCVPGEFIVILIRALIAAIV